MRSAQWPRRTLTAIFRAWRHSRRPPGISNGARALVVCAVTEWPAAIRCGSALDAGEHGDDAFALAARAAHALQRRSRNRARSASSACAIGAHHDLVAIAVRAALAHQHAQIGGGRPRIALVALVAFGAGNTLRPLRTIRAFWSRRPGRTGGARGPLRACRANVSSGTFRSRGADISFWPNRAHIPGRPLWPRRADGSGWANGSSRADVARRPWRPLRPRRSLRSRRTLRPLRPCRADGALSAGRSHGALRPGWDGLAVAGCENHEDKN